MNPNIILSGKPINALAAISSGNQAAAQTNQLRDQNALRQISSEYGAGIAQGDQEALNKLARINPSQAFDIGQATRQGERADAQLGMQQQQFDMKMRQYAQSLSAAERAQQAAQIESAVASAMSAQNPEQFDQIMQQSGLDQYVGQFANREAIASQYLSAAQALSRFDDQNAAPKPADEYGRYVQEEGAAGRQPLSRIDYAQAKKGQETIFGPDGKPIVQRGGARPGKSLTVEEGKNTGFLIRSRTSNQILNELEGQGTSIGAKILSGVPFDLGNLAQTEEYQRYDQAKRDFVNAILRRESGATIQQPEFENAERQYFPMPGDSPSVIKQKRLNRENTIAGLEIGSGRGAQDPIVQQRSPDAGQRLKYNIESGSFE